MIKGFRQIAVLTGISRIFGLIRVASFFYFFGAGGLLDAWFIAFKIPNLSRRLFGEGAASASFIPVYTQQMHSDPKKASILANTTMTAIFALLVTIVLFAFAGIWAYLKFFNVNSETQTILHLVSVLLPYIITLCLVAIIAGILNVHKHFASPAAAPIVLNIVIIGSLCVGGWVFKLEPANLVFVVAGAVLVGGLIQLAIQIPPLRSSGISIRPAWDVRTEAFKKMLERQIQTRAIEKIVDERGLTAYTMNFQHIGESMATPFYVCSKLMSRGIGYGGEGDVLTATLGRPLNALSSAAKFDEFFCADWKNNRILMSHMGESDSRFIKQGSSPRLAPRDALLNPHTCAIYRFQAEPGEVTFVNISPVDGREYRVVAGLLDIVDAQILDSIEGPHFQVATRIPVGMFLERYAAQGGGHHLYIAKGNILNGLSIFCKQLGFDLRVIEGV